MLNIEIMCVGKMSQRWFSDGFEEYRKRLSAFDKVTVTEIAEYRISDDTDSRSVKVALCVEGRQYSSEELALLLEKTRQETSRIVFVIGGSAGLSEEVKKECTVRMSMSRMTFPHQMARMILAEQLYRAESINSGMRYHK